MINVLLFLLVLGPSIYDISQGCGRVPADTTPAPKVVEDRNLTCTPEEVNTTACLNGGRCRAMIVGYDRVAYCHCTADYRGQRCQELNIDILFPSIDDGHVATAGIAASVAVLVVIIIVFTGVAIVYYKRKREEREARQKAHDSITDANGTLLPQNHIQPRKMDKLKYGNGNHVPVSTEENKYLNNCTAKEYRKEFEFKTTSV